MMTQAEPSAVEACAYSLASWALRTSFEGKLIGTHETILHDIRGKIIDLWKENKAEGDPGRLARTAGFNLFNLLLDYEVLHLEQPYNLILTGYTIQGKYALLRKRKGACLPHVLILHTYEPKLKSSQALPPDVATMARLVHVRTTTKHTNAIALHYPMFQGDHWFNKNINSQLARTYLESMLDIVKRSKYPSVGDHCKYCSTRSCMEVFNG